MDHLEVSKWDTSNPRWGMKLSLLLVGRDTQTVVWHWDLKWSMFKNTCWVSVNTERVPFGSRELMLSQPLSLYPMAFIFTYSRTEFALPSWTGSVVSLACHSWPISPSLHRLWLIPSHSFSPGQTFQHGLLLPLRHVAHKCLQIQESLACYLVD